MFKNCHFSVIFAPHIFQKIRLQKCFLVTKLKNHVKKLELKQFWKTEGEKADVINPLRSGCTIDVSYYISRREGKGFEMLTLM